MKFRIIKKRSRACMPFDHQGPIMLSDAISSVGRPLPGAPAELQVRTLLERAYQLAYGIRVTRAPEAAVACLLSAADLDSAEAMYNLSLSYLYGLGVVPSLARSRFWAAKCEARLARGAGSVASARLRSATAGLCVASSRPTKAGQVEALSFKAKGQ